MNEVEIFLKKLLKKNSTVVLAISGGPDSVCLFEILKKLAPSYSLKLICAHVNHNVRKESDEEALFVKNMCEQNNIIYEYYKIEDYKNNKFTEEEARKKRYSFFESIVKKYNAKYLMTAHHGNDLEETILMRIVRGSTLKGYAGIPLISKSKEYFLVRPLLYVTKKDILKYLEEEKIAYVVDKSNEEAKYTRNRYRKQLLPFLEKEDQFVHLKFLQFSEELQKYVNYTEKIIKDKLVNIYKSNYLDIDLLSKEDEFLQEKIIEYLIRQKQKDYIFNITKKQLSDIMSLIKIKKNKKLNLSDNFIARRSYNKLYIEKNIKDEDYEYTFENKISILNKYKIEIIEKTEEKSNNIIRLKKDEISWPLKIRNIRKGDRIKVKNLKGTKKIKDIFIDEKIDPQKRGSYPIVVDSQNNIIWLPGIKKSIFDKEIYEKYDIILKYMEEEYE